MKKSSILISIQVFYYKMQQIKSLTIVGASSDPQKYGHKVFRKAIEDKIKVFAVNPNTKIILEQEVYSSIADLPEITDYIAIYLPLGPNNFIKVSKNKSQTGDINM